MGANGDRRRTSIPRRDVERETRGPGPVITYTMSPEELERYRAMPAPAKPRSQDGKILRPAATIIKREETRMSQAQPKDGTPAFTPDKRSFLEEIAAGKSISQVEREWSMAKGAMQYWVRKWELKGIRPDRAKQLLDEIDSPTRPVAGPSADKSSQTAEQPEVSAALSGEHSAKAKRKQELAGAREEIEDLKDALTIANGNLKRVKAELQSEVDELKDERNVLLQTIERAVHDADPGYITLRVPILPVGEANVERIRIYDAVEALGHAAEAAGLDRVRIARELMLLNQRVVNFITADLTELLPGRDVSEHVQRFFAHYCESEGVREAG